MKKEAKNKALKLYLSSNGRISNVEISRLVDVSVNTIGRWKQKDDWESKLRNNEPTILDQVQEFVVRKKKEREEAFRLYKAAGGDISNAALAAEVKVNPVTIAKWKEADQWDKLLMEPEPEKLIETATIFKATGTREPVGDWEIDLDELANPHQIVDMNLKIDTLLKRDHLSAGELADLATAKSNLLEGIMTYLAILSELEE
jgi:transposase-like protein